MVLSFKKELNEEEVSVVVEPPLNLTSDIATLMREGNVFDELLTTPSQFDAFILQTKERIKAVILSSGRKLNL